MSSSPRGASGVPTSPKARARSAPAAWRHRSRTTSGTSRTAGRLYPTAVTSSSCTPRITVRPSPPWASNARPWSSSAGRHAAWRAAVPHAPSGPYELLISPVRHVPDLPAAGPELRGGLATILVDALTRLDHLLGADAPYMLWVHARPTDRAEHPAAHLHLHLAPALRAPGTPRHLAGAEFGAGVFFDPVDPYQAAAQWRSREPCTRPPRKARARPRGSPPATAANRKAPGSPPAGST